MFDKTSTVYFNQDESIKTNTKHLHELLVLFHWPGGKGKDAHSLRALSD